MKKPLFEIKRHNHIKHINKSMPLVAILFFAQNFIMQSVYPKESFGDYTIFCALTICSYIAILFFYDTKIKTYVYEDKVVTTTLFGSVQTIYLKDIEKILSVQEECSFSTILLCSKEKDMALRFIDFPLKTKMKILQLQQNLVIEEDLDQAA